VHALSRFRPDLYQIALQLHREPPPMTRRRIPWLRQTYGLSAKDSIIVIKALGGFA
jgi:hypothetical protein